MSYKYKGREKEYKLEHSRLPKQVKKRKNYSQKRYSTIEGKEAYKRATQKYKKSPKGIKKIKETAKGYYTLIGKDSMRKYYKTPKGMKVQLRSQLKYRRGITLEEYDGLFKTQEGKCAGCQKAQPHRRFDADHDHKCCDSVRSCGKCQRGLLCRKCNAILGLCNDSITVLLGLAQYLRIHRKEIKV